MKFSYVMMFVSGALAGNGMTQGTSQGGFFAISVILAIASVISNAHNQ